MKKINIGLIIKLFVVIICVLIGIALAIGEINPELEENRRVPIFIAASIGLLVILSGVGIYLNRSSWGRNLFFIFFPIGITSLIWQRNLESLTILYLTLLIFMIISFLFSRKFYLTMFDIESVSFKKKGGGLFLWGFLICLVYFFWGNGMFVSAYSPVDNQGKIDMVEWLDYIDLANYFSYVAQVSGLFYLLGLIFVALPFGHKLLNNRKSSETEQKIESEK